METRPRASVITGVEVGGGRGVAVGPWGGESSTEKKPWTREIERIDVHEADKSEKLISAVYFSKNSQLECNSNATRVTRDKPGSYYRIEYFESMR